MNSLVRYASILLVAFTFFAPTNELTAKAPRDIEVGPPIVPPPEKPVSEEDQCLDDASERIEECKRDAIDQYYDDGEVPDDIGEFPPSLQLHLQQCDVLHEVLVVNCSILDCSLSDPQEELCLEVENKCLREIHDDWRPLCADLLGKEPDSLELEDQLTCDAYFRTHCEGLKAQCRAEQCKFNEEKAKELEKELP